MQKSKCDDCIYNKITHGERFWECTHPIPCEERKISEYGCDYAEENKTHELKIAPEYFKAVDEGVKTFELRYNDRNFKVGDKLILKEYEHLFDMEYRYTGKEITKEVSYILEGGQYGLAKNFVILAIK